MGSSYYTLPQKSISFQALLGLCPKIKITKKSKWHSIFILIILIAIGIGIYLIENNKKKKKKINF